MAPTAQAVPANGTLAPVPASGTESRTATSATSTTSVTTTANNNNTLRSQPRSPVTREASALLARTVVSTTPPSERLQHLANPRQLAEYHGVKEKLRKHVEGLTKELYEQLVKKMFATLECTPDGKQLRQNKRLNMETLRDVQSNLRGEMDQLVEDLFVPFMSQINKSNGSNVEPVELRDAKVKLRKCMDDIVRDLFGPFLNELNDLFKSADGVNLVDVCASVSETALRGGSTVANIGTTVNVSSADSRDKMELVQTIARLQRKAQEKAGMRVMADNGDEVVDGVTSLRIQCIHDGCPAIANDWTELEVHLRECHGFIGSGQFDTDFDDDHSLDNSVTLLLSMPPLDITITPSLRERHAQMIAVMRAKNVKTIFIDDLMEGEDELDTYALDFSALERPKTGDDGDQETEGRSCLESIACTEDGCYYVAFSSVQLNRHFIHTHGIMPHCCLVCNDVFDKNMYGNELFGHIWERHREFNGDYHCKQCKQQFRQHALLQQHIHLFHMDSTVSAFDMADYEVIEDITWEGSA